MKSNVCFAVGLITLAVFPLMSNATLIGMSNTNDHVVYDDVSGYYWYWDLTSFSGQSWTEQVSSIAALNNGGGYYGETNWHVADQSDMDSLWQHTAEEIGSAFNLNTFQSVVYDITYPLGLGSGDMGDVHANLELWLGRYDQEIEDGPIAAHQGAMVQHGWTEVFLSDVLLDAGYSLDDPEVQAVLDLLGIDTEAEDNWSKTYILVPDDLSDLPPGSTLDLDIGVWAVSTAAGAPVPEPATLYLLCLGLAGLILMKRTEQSVR